MLNHLKCRIIPNSTPHNFPQSIPKYLWSLLLIKISLRSCGRSWLTSVGIFALKWKKSFSWKFNSTPALPPLSFAHLALSFLSLLYFPFQSFHGCCSLWCPAPTTASSWKGFGHTGVSLLPEVFFGLFLDKSFTLAGFSFFVASAVCVLLGNIAFATT